MIEESENIQINKRRCQKIIFIAPILEYPPAGGPQMSVTNAIKALAQICELHIITTVPESSFSKSALLFIKEHCKKLLFAPSSKLFTNQPIIDRMLRRFKRVEGAALLAYPDAKFVASYANNNNINIIWIDRVLEHAFSLFSLLRKTLPAAKIVGDTEAVYSRFILRETPFIKNPLRKAWVSFKGKRKQWEEKRLVDYADIVTAVSELDANYFRSIALSPEKIKLFSNIVDLGDYTGFCKGNSTPKSYMLLTGSFGNVNSPMDRAAKWLAEDILPKVLLELPNVQVYIVGRNADKTLLHYNSETIKIIGRVPSIEPYLNNAFVSLVPLQYESGTRFKILEAGAASVPCISTTLGAEGLEITNGENIIIADTTEDFARAIIKLYRNREYANLLAANLYSLIYKKYSLSAQRKDGESILNYLTD